MHTRWKIRPTLHDSTPCQSILYPEKPATCSSFLLLLGSAKAAAVELLNHFRSTITATRWRGSSEGQTRLIGLWVLQHVRPIMPTFSGGIPTIRQTLNGTQLHKSISKINQVAKPMSAVLLWLISIQNSTRICPSERKHCPKNLIIALKNLHSRHAYLSADTKWPVDENADCSGCRRLVDCCCVHVLNSICMALTWQPRNRLNRERGLAPPAKHLRSMRRKLLEKCGFWRQYCWGYDFGFVKKCMNHWESCFNMKHENYL